LFYSISAQRWYRIEHKVFKSLMSIIVDDWLMFSDKELYAFILEGWKGNELGTCDLEDEKCNFLQKEDHCVRDCGLFEEWL
jgi:hypothetical protein